jgi:hypothetical protein
MRQADRSQPNIEALLVGIATARRYQTVNANMYS